MGAGGLRTLALPLVAPSPPGRSYTILNILSILFSPSRPVTTDIVPGTALAQQRVYGIFIAFDGSPTGTGLPPATRPAPTQAYADDPVVPDTGCSGVGRLLEGLKGKERWRFRA